jgi:integrase/recombinase XerD
VDTLESLSEQEKKILLDSSSGLDRIMLMLLFDSGLKVEDLIGTKISDIDLEGGTILIRSTGEKKKISPKVMAELKSYLEIRSGQVYLFEGRCGKPITGKWKRCVFEKLIRKAVSKSAKNL